MWHEARKQEKKIREVMINYQKRAERRREHYEKMRVNPTQFLRIYGSKCQMHLDPTGGSRDSTMSVSRGHPKRMRPVSFSVSSLQSGNEASCFTRTIKLCSSSKRILDQVSSVIAR